jgi:hypothetical protein
MSNNANRSNITSDGGTMNMNPDSFNSSNNSIPSSNNKHSLNNDNNDSRAPASKKLKLSIQDHNEEQKSLEQPSYQPQHRAIMQAACKAFIARLSEFTQLAESELKMVNDDSIESYITANDFSGGSNWENSAENKGIIPPVPYSYYDEQTILYPLPQPPSLHSSGSTFAPFSRLSEEILRTSAPPADPQMLSATHRNIVNSPNFSLLSRSVTDPLGFASQIASSPSGGANNYGSLLGRFTDSALSGQGSLSGFSAIENFSGQSLERLEQRRDELQSKINQFQLTAGRIIKHGAEPPRNKCHWDYLLGECEWLANDFVREKAWKVKMAKKLSQAVLKYHEKQKTKAW